ncbi:hypothetical protein BOX15_Mlig023025g7, partial [Macrostomum lignano]
AMASGVAVDPSVKDDFNDIKLGHKYAYMVFKIDSESMIKTERTCVSCTYDEFTSSLPANECRYAVFDYKYCLDDGSKREKLLFIHWAPDSAKIRDKMLYASSKDALKRDLKGVVEIQASDLSEVDEVTIKEKVKASG